MEILKNEKTEIETAVRKTKEETNIDVEISKIEKYNGWILTKPLRRLHLIIPKMYLKKQ